MKDLELMYTILFIFSPIVGFIPQIYTNQILFPELLSALTIVANILKIYHFRTKSFFSVIPMQGAFIILLHSCLMYYNKSTYSITEEKITKRLRISSKQLFVVYIGLISITSHFVGLVLNTYEFCGLLSLVFEVSVNFIQLLIEKQNKGILDETKKRRSQKELYLVWIVGDICRILFMMSVETPKVYTAASFIQLAIDGYLLCN
ncbi:hypothetical protein P3W45_001428 [Vairimorpha bombi]|jgi:hypothetical protein